ncbi:MAG: chorismate mutase [Chloroflexi bacterium OLB15]|nr:MAG: chorismate mutase [Chloroflexi bacterium OLB15]
MFRGVRGATTVESNTAEAILAATLELLEAMVEANGIDEEDVVSVFFTASPDLNAAYPAKAARDMGWRRTALLGCQEMDVPNGIKQCIRVLIHWSTPKALDEIVHVYMREALILRPDLYPDNKLVIEHKQEEK